jgi:hypothetical protein
VSFFSCRSTYLSWPYQQPSYLSALPGVAAPGLNFGTDLPSKVYLVTSLADTVVGGADPSYGPNCFSGTWRYCWQADQGAGFHKYMKPLVGGYLYLGRSVLAPATRGNFDYIGHAAPGAGLFIRCGVPNTMGGSNTRLWHLPSWMGDEAAASGVTTLHAGNRDCIQMSNNGAFPATCAMINCEGRFSMDEAFQCFDPMDGISWIRCAVYDPLHTPPDFGDPTIVNHEPGADHGYGHLIGGSGFVDNSLVMQSVYAHTTDRNPLAASNRHSHVNNLHYDHGRPAIAKGEGLVVCDNGGFNVAAGLSQQCNLVGNVAVRGANNNSALVLAKVSGTLSTGSTAHSAYNCQFGWTAPTSQDDFFTTKPGGYLQPTLRSTAWYDGLGPNYSGALIPAADPLNPTVREGVAFTNLMRRTVGCKPGRRHKYQNGVNRLMDKIDGAIKATPTSTQWINTVLEAGDWPVLPVLSIDPSAPGAEYHAAIPLGSDRDDILVSGRFANGASKVGYTKIRAWVIEQYFHSLEPR